MSVRLNSPIWDKAKRANKYAKAIYAVGVEAVKDVDLNYRTAKRTGVRARVATVKFSGRGADRKAVRTGRTKVVTRSAYGETPARVTGQLQKGTKVKRISATAVRIFNDVPHGKHLEPPARLNRPFLRKPIDENRAKYTEIVRKSLLS